VSTFFCGTETDNTGVESVDKHKHERGSQITNENRDVIPDEHVKSVEVRAFDPSKIRSSFDSSC
jgi:hypothetical protein